MKYFVFTALALWMSAATSANAAPIDLVRDAPFLGWITPGIEYAEDVDFDRASLSSNGVLAGSDGITISDTAVLVFTTVVSLSDPGGALLGGFEVASDGTFSDILLTGDFAKTGFTIPSSSEEGRLELLFDNLQGPLASQFSGRAVMDIAFGADARRRFSGESLFDVLSDEAEAAGGLSGFDGEFIVLSNVEPAPAPIPLPAGAWLLLTGCFGFAALRHVKPCGRSGY